MTKNKSRLWKQMRWLAAASGSLGTYADPSPSTYMNTYKHKRSIVPIRKTWCRPCSHKVTTVDLRHIRPLSAVNYKLRLRVSLCPRRLSRNPVPPLIPE